MSVSAIAEEKAALRRQIRSQLLALSEEARKTSDRALFDRFLALPQLEQMKTVFAFWGVPKREPETGFLVTELNARGITVGLPRMLPGRGMEVRRYDPDVPLVSAGFGLLEPEESCSLIEKADIDLVLVPALCYDRWGYRLGFGGGYYDRWLADCSALKVGLCREMVLQQRVPVEEHDSRVDLLLTETACLSGFGQEKGGA